MSTGKIYPAYTIHGGVLGYMTIRSAEARWGADKVCFRSADLNGEAHIEVWVKCGCCYP